MDKALADRLFAPFAEASIPKHCSDGSQLRSLLETPLNVPLYHIIPESEVTLRLLFSHATSSHAAAGSSGTQATTAEWSSTLAQLSYPQLCTSRLFMVLAVAANKQATARMSEMSWCGWWDALTREIAEHVAWLCSVDIRTDRDVQDNSITIDAKRRDFLLWAQSVLIMGGEHKKAGQPLPTDELTAKHKGANPSLYGLLNFILLYASAGSLFQLYAIPVAGTQLTHIGGAG
jgi:hypothetical protein